jgi:hypothetical protein
MLLTVSLILVEKPLQLVAFLPRVSRPICTRPDVRYISPVGLVVFAGDRKARR